MNDKEFPKNFLRIYYEFLRNYYELLGITLYYLEFKTELLRSVTNCKESIGIY